MTDVIGRFIQQEVDKELKIVENTGAVAEDNKRLHRVIAETGRRTRRRGRSGHRKDIREEGERNVRYIRRLQCYENTQTSQRRREKRRKDRDSEKSIGCP